MAKSIARRIRPTKVLTQSREAGLVVHAADVLPPHFSPSDLMSSVYQPSE
jgi:hypothetical protein